MIGERLGHFRLLDLPGTGARGGIYRARDEQLEREVALEVLPAASFPDPAARTAWLRAAQAASKLNHPHICAIHEAGAVDDQVFIATELVQGRPLAARLAEGSLGQDELLRYGLQLTDALAYAHEHGAVHSDLKSSNVFITPDGRVKVLGFGLARPMSRDELTAATSTPQTPAGTRPGLAVEALAYLAPEQLRGQPADSRSDVWALGALLHEMATGARPFQGTTPVELSSAILSQPAPPLPATVPAEFHAVIERCLRKEPGQRYRRASDVHAALEAIRSGMAPPRRETARRGWPGPVWLTVAAAAAVFLAIAAVLYLGVMPGRRPPPAQAPAATPHAVAVLPLVNISHDPEQQYLVDGLTDALIDDLSKIGGTLRVISRTSTAVYATAPKPVRQIARELGVDAIVEGSVAREGSLVRVTAALIDAATEQRLWSDRYERNLTSVLTVQADIARAVARSIKGTLTPEEEQKLSGRREVNPQVFEAYTKGMYWLNQSTPDALKKGMDYLHEAIEKDPTDALAYAGLADGYVTLAHGADPPPDSLKRAKAAAQTAVELEPNLPQGTFALGVIKGYEEWDWSGGIVDLQRTIDLNPSFAMAHYHLAWFLALVGRMPEAIEEHIRAQEADPLNPLMTAFLGELYRWDGQYDKAIIEARKSIELNAQFPPGHFVLSWVFSQQGKHQEAIEAMKKAGEAAPEWRGALGGIYALAGRTDEARRILAELNAKKANSWDAVWLASTYAALGEKDPAFRWLDYEHPHAATPWLVSKEWSMFMKPILDDPRYAELQRKWNVPKW